MKPNTNVLNSPANQDEGITMGDVEMAVHQCGVRGDSSLDFKHTSSQSLALCSVPLERARPTQASIPHAKTGGRWEIGIGWRMPDWYFACMSRARCDRTVPKQRQSPATRPKTNKSLRTIVH